VSTADGRVSLVDPGARRGSRPRRAGPADPDSAPWPVRSADIDAACTSYWRVRSGWQDTPAADTALTRRWVAAALPGPRDPRPGREG
jgi:hypothetical protein